MSAMQTPGKMSVDILIRAITLLHRENELGDVNDNSKDLVRTVVGIYKNRPKTLTGGESNTYDNLVNLITDMVTYPENYDKTSLLESLEIILKDKADLLRVVDKSVNNELTTTGLKRSILSLRSRLTNFYKETEITSLVSAASYKLSMNKLGEESMYSFIEKLTTNLESLISVTKAKDPGLLEELDVGDEESMNSLLGKVKDKSNNIGKFITGWKGINTMTGGGFSSHETVMINALQHKYKSGFTQSLFMQLPMYNKPEDHMKDPAKKPLMLYVSFEDDTEIIAEFMYKYLYYNEHKQAPDLTTVTTGEMSKYIKEKLGANGYHIKILRVNPSEWTFKHLFNKILELEAAGYDIHACFVDYLAKLPTIGCTNTGPGGTDVRDMLNRVRNFFGSKKILFVTPHQLSSEAKQLIRNGVSDLNFVKEVAEKGYTELSKQLDQVVDLELYIHIGRRSKKPVLTIQRGKHRTPNIIDDDKKYTVLDFPYKAPIPADIYDEDNGETTTNLTGESDGFDF